MRRRILDKTTMILLLMILIFSGCSIFYISMVTNAALKEEARSDLATLAVIVAGDMDGDAIAALKPGDEQTPQFIATLTKLQGLKQKLRDIRYVYIMRRSGDAVEFVVDADYGYSAYAAPIGQVYQTPSPEMIAGFQDTSVEKEFTTDEWGTVLSGYSPIRDSTGAVVAIVGVDMDQQSVINRQSVISKPAYLLMFLALLMAAFGVVSVERTRSGMINDLKDREQRFRTLFESTYDAILIVRDGKYIDCNQRALRLFRGTKDQIVGKTPADFSPETQPDGRGSQLTSREVLNLALKGQSQIFTWKHRTLDGEEFDAEVSMTVIELEGVKAVQTIVRDITERKRAEDAIRQSEQKYRMLTESSPDAIYIVDADHKLIYANMLASTLMGEGLREIIGSPEIEAHPPSPENDRKVDSIVEVLATGQILKREDRLTGRSGRVLWFDSTFMPLYNEQGSVYAVLTVSHDITERKNMETQIQSSLKEKDYLLKEIHHRVKNNLQVISSLLSMQARKATDPREKETLTESQNRVKSIALVHEKLYQSKSLDRIEYGDYLNKVINHLFESFNVNPAQITWTVSAKDVYVNIEQAVPCSLILNELITNSLKYAFPEGRKGEIAISFVLENNRYILDYRDNGVGVPPGAKLERAGSLGTQLITGLTHQLDGTIAVDTSAGVHYTIIFPQKQKGDGSP